MSSVPQRIEAKVDAEAEVDVEAEHTSYDDDATEIVSVVQPCKYDPMTRL